MTKLALAACAGVFVLAANGADLNATAPLNRKVPFMVEAGEDASALFPGAPRLQSFAWAQWDGKWIFIAGRSTGYHGVGGGESDFSRSNANARIWVVDPTRKGPARTYSFKLEDLPSSLNPVKDQWAASNPLFFQDGEILYIAGGYGRNSAGAWLTYPMLSSVRLPELVDSVMQSSDSFCRTITFVENENVQIAGGELLKLDDGFFYAIGGHVFTGSYSEFEAADEKSGSGVSQTYTSEIRKLQIAHDSIGRLSVALMERYSNPEFARRDLNAAYRILPDGHSLGAAAYGGVFTKDQLGFTKPIYWDSKSAPAPDRSFDQQMSGYTCAHMLLFDPDSHAMYTTFFGGISRWTWNYAAQRPELAPFSGDKTQNLYYDGLTWIDHVTTLATTSAETFESVQSSTRLPGYVGSNAAFLPVPGLARIREDAEVFDLSALRGKRTLIGYIFGGIRAYPKEFPYRDDAKNYRSGNVPTKASDMIVPVYVTVPEK